MSKALQDRLQEAQTILKNVGAALDRHPSNLPNEVESSFRKLVKFQADIEYLLCMIEARAATRQLLDGLEIRADRDGLVPLGAARVKYQHVRFLGEEKSDRRRSF